jgi:hypothetical protein
MEEISQARLITAIATKADAGRDRFNPEEQRPNRGPRGFLQEYSYIIFSEIGLNDFRVESIVQVSDKFDKYYDKSVM